MESLNNSNFKYDINDVIKDTNTNLLSPTVVNAWHKKDVLLNSLLFKMIENNHLDCKYINEKIKFIKKETSNDDRLNSILLVCANILKDNDLKDEIFKSMISDNLELLSKISTLNSPKYIQRDFNALIANIKDNIEGIEELKQFVAKSPPTHEGQLHFDNSDLTEKISLANRFVNLFSHELYKSNTLSDIYEVISFIKENREIFPFIVFKGIDNIKNDEKDTFNTERKQLIKTRLGQFILSIDCLSHDLMKENHLEGII